MASVAPRGVAGRLGLIRGVPGTTRSNFDFSETVERFEKGPKSRFGFAGFFLLGCWAFAGLPQGCRGQAAPRAATSKWRAAPGATTPSCPGATTSKWRAAPGTATPSWPRHDDVKLAAAPGTATPSCPRPTTSKRRGDNVKRSHA